MSGEPTEEKQPRELKAFFTLNLKRFDKSDRIEFVYHDAKNNVEGNIEGKVDLTGASPDALPAFLKSLDEVGRMIMSGGIPVGRIPGGVPPPPGPEGPSTKIILDIESPNSRRFLKTLAMIEPHLNPPVKEELAHFLDHVKEITGYDVRKELGKGEKKEGETS